MEEIRTDDVFQSSAPLSQAIEHDGRVYVSGCVPYPPDATDVVSDDVGEQTEQVMRNIGAILDAAGTAFDRVVRSRVFLADMDEFQAMNDAYAEFVTEPYPARTAVEAQMANPDIAVEIDVTAGGE